MNLIHYIIYNNLKVEMWDICEKFPSIVVFLLSSLFTNSKRHWGPNMNGVHFSKEYW